MGKIKQMLIDTDQEDQTDPRDTGNYGQSEEEPTITDHAMVELARTVKTLYDHRTELNDYDLREIHCHINTLKTLPKTSEIPF